MNIHIRTIRTFEDMIEAVNSVGFLPFFSNAVRGWSIGEHTDPALWFSDTEDGPWEWKGPAVQT